MRRPAIAIHGGAGTILKSQMTDEMEFIYRKSLLDAVNIGWQILNGNGAALDAVTETVKSLEDNPVFNAGKGSVFTSNGTHEMDAAIMDGRDLNAGSVALVSKIKNPILLAKAVMEKTHHVLLCSEAAENLAQELGFELMDEKYFYTEARYIQLKNALEKKKITLDHSSETEHGTVGAVAVDISGNLASATSTGGMTNKMPGRIGDSAVTGAGNYANNNTCAVSCTGQGEFFMRGVSAFDVSAMMDYMKLSLAESADIVIFEKLETLGGKGGLIAVDSFGNIAMPFNSEGMYRACMSQELKSPIVAIYKGD